jgi:hypothetical protein
MLAQRMPGILPEMSLDESFEVARIHSVAGLARPGEISLARPAKVLFHMRVIRSLISSWTKIEPDDTFSHPSALRHRIRRPLRGVPPPGLTACQRSSCGLQVMLCNPVAGCNCREPES